MRVIAMENGTGNLNMECNLHSDITSFVKVKNVTDEMR